MATSQYPNINESQFAGLLQVATAAADAQERRASALGKRKRDDEAFIDHQLRTPADRQIHQDIDPPTLSSSAAVLFREPSEKSKKYSRPPLGKVYTDLELAPEIFLQLQSAAKDFMLDPAHPERKGVVGQKKQNSNNDIAKLKLWNCVDEFLQTPSEKTTEINAEYYFGHAAGNGIPNQPERSFFWPEDKDQVVKMCMPLFRKMVTNERQRLYASETRKQEPRKDTDDKKSSNTTRLGEDGSPSADTHYHPEDVKTSIPAHDSSNLFLAQAQAQAQAQTGTGQVVLHINIIAKEGESQGRRVTQRISMPSSLVTSRQALFDEVRKRYGSLPDHDEGSVVKVWLEQGLVAIRTDNEWMVALLSAETVDWMDGELRVLIEI